MREKTYVDELTFAATTVFAALLSQASQDTYAAARDVIRRLLRRGDQPDTAAELERLDQDRASVMERSEPERDEAARRAAAGWALDLEGLLRADHEAFQELRALAERNGPATVINQHNHGSGTFINGSVAGGLTINHGAAHGRDT
ncbi:hypothetical protein STVIR_1418 [Streptomyces viridochromogenes Tue57]|uniref:Uncharacterized protein n=1 Tax=Streptomyces viridochromogenes Tue57 TaxID=1160705 RepID=L8PME0_STRVR|nr:hypothetical protein STVIR_1418 [Streptomyces viridochromogenes Tue57]